MSEVYRKLKMQATTSELGGFNLAPSSSNTEPIEFKCPICLLLVRKPVQLRCCGQFFCFSCMQHLRESQGMVLGETTQRWVPCPSCRAPVADEDMIRRKQFHPFELRRLRGRLGSAAGARLRAIPLPCATTNSAAAPSDSFRAPSPPAT